MNEKKRYLVIGNPIEHSLSPKLHNYWIKTNNINAVYDKLKLNISDLKDLFTKFKKKKIDGINVTVPFKKEVIPYLDKLTPEAEQTQSVNTIYLDNQKITGHNTDIEGFELAIKNLNFNVLEKKIFILGAGGVVPSIIYALNKMKASKIILSNRTKIKAENIKSLFNNLTVIDWGMIPSFDMIINATSIGLNPKDRIHLNLSDVGNGKFFYDIIYNPKETDFLKKGKELGNKIENGEKMFVYQAASAFKIWHGISPEINDELIELLKQ